MNWYALYTKPQKEDMVANSLSKAGLEVYSPKLATKKYAAGRYRNVVGPLFPCYIFARFEPLNSAWMVKYTRGIRTIVGGDSPWPVADEVLDIMKLHEEDGIITIRPPELRAGDHVIVRDGPFEGLRGIFEKETGTKERVVLLLNALEFQARMVIEKVSLIKAA